MAIEFSGVALALTLAVTAGIPPAQELPSWQVIKTAKQCVLIQRLKAPEPAFVTFESAPGSDSFSIMISIAKMAGHPAAPVAAEIGFDGANKTIKANAMPGQMDGSLPDMLRFEFISPDDFASAAGATALKISFARTKVGPFPLPDEAIGVETFRNCLAAQLISLDADPAQFGPSGTPPVPLKSRQYFLSIEQMRSAIAAGTAPGAPASFKLTIDTQGAVSDCARLRPTDSEKVEKAACSFLKNQTLFKPARDPQGQAVIGVATYDLQLYYNRKM